MKTKSLHITDAVIKKRINISQRMASNGCATVKDIRDNDAKLAEYSHPERDTRKDCIRGEVAKYWVHQWIHQYVISRNTAR